MGNGFFRKFFFFNMKFHFICPSVIHFIEIYFFFLFSPYHLMKLMSNTEIFSSCEQTKGRGEKGKFLNKYGQQQQVVITGHHDQCDF